MQVRLSLRQSITLLLAAQAGAAHAAAFLDSSFGSGGIVKTTASASAHDQIQAITIDSNNKIVAVGYNGSATAGNFVLARYNDSDGSLDSGFGSGGLVELDFQSGTNRGDNAYALDIDTDGKIIVAGFANGGFAVGQFALARYDADGTLDATFGTSGTTITPFTSGAAIAYGMARDSTGRIILAGMNNATFALARYSSNGILDTSFGTNGLIEPDPVNGGTAHTVRAIAVDSNDRVIVAGFTSTSTSSDFILARYTTSGILDSSFGSGGIVNIDFGGKDQAYAMTLDSSGNIVVGGYSGGALALARYTSTGTPDASFGSNGKVTTDATGANDIIYGLTMDNADNIVVGGMFGSNFGIARYTPSGLLDTTFTATGLVNTDVAGGGMQDLAYAVRVDSSNRIIAAGRAYSGTNYDFALARYLVNNAPTVASISVSGSLQIGQSITGGYTYSDLESDLEDGSGSGSSYQFFRSSDALLDGGDGEVANGATGGAGSGTEGSYTLQAADVGSYLLYCVTPRAVTGNLVGTVTCTSTGPVPANSAPTVATINLSGSLQEGATVVGSYTYADGEGDLEETSASGSSYRFVRSADTVLDAGDSDVASGTTGGASSNYAVQAADVGGYLFYCVTPRAATGTVDGSESCTTAQGPVAANTAPSATSVAISGTAQTGIVVTGSYTYTDGESDPEDTSASGTSYRFVRSTDALLDAGDSDVASGTTSGTSSSYTVQAADVGSYLLYCVTPRAATGTTTGSESCSSAAGPVAANSAPTATAVALGGTAQVGQLMMGSYTYVDSESDPEDTSTGGTSYRYVRSTDALLDAADSDVASGTTGGANTTYTVQEADAENYLFYCVTPRATSGNPTGAEACSGASAQVSSPTEVPTLAPWAMALLPGMLGVAGLFGWRRRND